MPKVKINGLEYEFSAGTKILEACRGKGVYVPHFCYHSALTVVGSCRMCKVEIHQGGRKWVDISCKVEVADGMEIFTASQNVKKQQEMTLEYLLANHPLDCPICDDAGECDLQDFYFKFGKYDSRMREVKIHKHKAQDIGNKVVLDSERCVLCSRCVRFTQDITKTHELGIFGMGATEELALRPGAKLDNDYSGNVVDLCPVGALTDKDFRFKRRVWYLKMTPSICQGCSRGCNVRIDHDVNDFHWHKRDQKMRTMRTETTFHQRIQRLKPRENADVNSHWICDHGRYNYKDTDADNRIEHAMMSNGEAQLSKIDLNDAIKKFADVIAASTKGGSNKLMVVVSPNLTVEEVFAVWMLFVQKLKIANVDHRLPIPSEWYGDDLLRTPDPYANRTFCEWLKIIPTNSGAGINELDSAIQAGKIDTVISFLAEPSRYLSRLSLSKLKGLYFVGRNLTEETAAFVNMVLPAAAWGEYRGSFVNFEGRLQRLERAVEPLGDAKPVWELVNLISSSLKKPLNWNDPNQIWKHIQDEIPVYAGITLDAIGPSGILTQKFQLKATG